MISKKTYIPAKPRNKKLIGGMMVASGSTAVGGPQHSHANKPVIDRLTQVNIDVLSYLSLYQTGVQQTQMIDEFGDPVFDLNGDPVMIDVLVPVLDSFGNPVLDEYGDPVMETVPVYAIKSTASFFSEKEVSAYGLGDEGSGGGGGFDMLLAWANYSEETEQWVISAALAKDMLDRIVVLEAGSGGGGSTVTWGTESGGYVPLTVDSVAKSIALSTHNHSGVYAPVSHNHSGVYAPVSHNHSGVYAPVTHDHSGVYAPVSHNHSGVYEPVFTKNNAFNKDFGTTSGTVAQGNDSRIVNGETAYGWGNHASAGYALTSHTHSQYALTTHDHSGVYEPVFSKNTAFNKDFGTTSGTVAQGNDSRIINGQTAYGWGDHASAGYATGSALANYALSTHNHSGVYEPVFSKNTAFNKDFGTTSGTVAQGNDSRIVNGQTAYGWGNHASAGYALSTHTHLQYAPVSHNHSGVYEPVFSKNTAFNKDFGTTSGTVAEGNDSRIVNGQTAYSWGNHASAGYASSSALANYVTLDTTQTISGAKTFSANLTTSVSVTTPKVIFAAAGWSLEQTGTELQMKYNGTAKMRFLSGGSIVATQEITAFG